MCKCSSMVHDIRWHKWPLALLLGLVWPSSNILVDGHVSLLASLFPSMWWNTWKEWAIFDCSEVPERLCNFCLSLGLPGDCQWFGQSVRAKQAWHLRCRVLRRRLTDKCLHLTGMSLQKIPGRLLHCEPYSSLQCSIHFVVSIVSYGQFYWTFLLFIFFI